jgi:hypothetical protein
MCRIQERVNRMATVDPNAGTAQYIWDSILHGKTLAKKYFPTSKVP